MSADKGTPENMDDASQQQALEAIQKCQDEIVRFRSKCDSKIFEIEKNYSRIVKPYMERRNSLTRDVPQFWSKSLLNHPLISTIFEPGEREVLHYLSNLEIEEDLFRPDNFKIQFFFRRNPYFENRVLTKQFNENGSVNTDIKWKNGHAFPTLTEHEIWESDDLGMECKGFFRWFLDPEEQSCDPVADIIKSYIWFDPLEFYLENSLDEKSAIHLNEERKLHNLEK